MIITMIIIMTIIMIIIIIIIINEQLEYNSWLSLDFCRSNDSHFLSIE